MEVSINGGIPIAGWFTMENPNLKWMRTGGTPILGHPHVVSCFDEDSFLANY